MRFDTLGRRSSHGQVDHPDARKAGRLRCSMLGSNQGEVMDVSATGLRILLRRNPDLKAGENFDLDVETLSGAMRVVCRVVWIRLNAERKFEMGVEFVKLDADRRKRLLEAVLQPTRAETVKRGWSVVNDARLEDQDNTAEGRGSHDEQGG